MENLFICPICGNSSKKYVGYRNGKPYCRKCISFKGEPAKYYVAKPSSSRIYLSYDLSVEQQAISNALIENYKKGKNSFVNAVCGSGKTEIVLGLISYAIQCGEKVGFAVPRRDVAIELYDRFVSIFRDNKIALVYGNHHDVLSGNLVCLTTHQLYRYEHYFNLLIMDEIDAFPYKGNDVLKSYFKRSLKGNYVLMSATVSPTLKKEIIRDGCIVLELLTRFHKHPLPVPEAVEANSLILYYKLIKQLYLFTKNNKPVFVFCPTIEICETTYKIVKIFIKNGMCIHSKKYDRETILNKFRNGDYKFLITTAVLERGITVKDLQVIVLFADHKIYDCYSLIQIAGRVGRKKEFPEGRVIFLARKVNRQILQCIDEINRANSSL